MPTQAELDNLLSGTRENLQIDGVPYRCKYWSTPDLRTLAGTASVLLTSDVCTIEYYLQGKRAQFSETVLKNLLKRFCQDREWRTQFASDRRMKSVDPHPTRRCRLADRDVDIDTLMADAICALNNQGYLTRNCCAGKRATETECLNAYIQFEAAPPASLQQVWQRLKFDSFGFSATSTYVIGSAEEPNRLLMQLLCDWANGTLDLSGKRYLEISEDDLEPAKQLRQRTLRALKASGFPVRRSSVTHSYAFAFIEFVHDVPADLRVVFSALGFTTAECTVFARHSGLASVHRNQVFLATLHDWHHDRLDATGARYLAALNGGHQTLSVECC